MDVFKISRFQPSSINHANIGTDDEDVKVKEDFDHLGRISSGLK